MGRIRSKYLRHSDITKPKLEIKEIIVYGKAVPKNLSTTAIALIVIAVIVLGAAIVLIYWKVQRKNSRETPDPVRTVQVNSVEVERTRQDGMMADEERIVNPSAPEITKLSPPSYQDST